MNARQQHLPGLRTLLAAGVLLALSVRGQQPPTAPKVYLANDVGELRDRTRFDEMRTWPPQDEQILAPLVVQKEGLDEEVRRSWQRHEDWLLAMHDVYFHREEVDSRKPSHVYWLQDWPAAGHRTTFAIWIRGNGQVLGRREHVPGDGFCRFAFVPIAPIAEATMTLESTRDVVNALLASRVQISLEELAEPRRVRCADPDTGATVMKEFNTRVSSSFAAGEGFYLTYSGDYHADFCPRYNVWASPQVLFFWVPDPWVAAGGGDGAIGAPSLMKILRRVADEQDAPRN